MFCSFILIYDRDAIMKKNPFKASIKRLQSICMSKIVNTILIFLRTAEIETVFSYCTFLYNTVLKRKRGKKERERVCLI